MYMTYEQLCSVYQHLSKVRIPWYQPLSRFRMRIALMTIYELIAYMKEQGGGAGPTQPGCGCFKHSNPRTN